MRTLLISMFLVCLNSLQAQDYKTNSLFQVVLTKDSEKTLSSIVTANLITTGNRSLYNRFGPFAELTNLRSRMRLEYFSFDYNNTQGENLVRDTVGDTAAETAIQFLPLDEWGHGRIAAFFTRLVHGSVANTAGNHLNPVSTVPTLSELTLDERPASSIDYGYRLFRTEPYLYLQNGWGWLDGQRLLITDIRCASVLDNLDQIGIINISGLASLYVIDDMRLVAGASFYPTELDSDRWSPAFILRLEHHGHHMSWYTGFVTRRYETLMSVGITMEWDKIFH